ncbi:NAD(P)H-quinone oxidoreductase subunit 5,chloroplastic [Trichinella pseudospiralis]
MFRSNLDDTIVFDVINHSEFSCNSVKGSEGIVHHMKVIVDISYDEINGFLMAIQFVLFGSILLTLCCGISHIKKVFQGSWSLCDIFDVLLITASHFLSLFTVRMSKIFVSCATDQNYDLLIAAAFGSTVLSFGNAMLLFFQLNKTPTVSRADHRLKIELIYTIRLFGWLAVKLIFIR